MGYAAIEKFVNVAVSKLDQPFCLNLWVLVDLTRVAPFYKEGYNFNRTFSFSL